MDPNLYGYVLNNPINFFDSKGLFTRPVPGQIRGPDRGAREGGYYGANRTNKDGVNYPHTGVDLLSSAGANVVSPIDADINLSGSEGVLICQNKGTICCDGEEKPYLICWRLVHITPTVNSGKVSEGQVVGTVNSWNNPKIPPHPHIELYVTVCWQKRLLRVDPTNFFTNEHDPLGPTPTMF